MCVFLLSTAYHRNGKPVSTVTLFSVNLKQGWMLHVANYSGNVVMVLCISLYVKPLQPCRFLGFEQLIFSRWQGVMSSVGHMGAGFFPLHAHTCMCLPSTLPRFCFFQTCPFQSLNLDLILLFIAFACLKKQTPPHPPLNFVLYTPIAFNVLFEMECEVIM